MVANAQRSDPTNKQSTVAGISITDQITGDLLPAAGRRQLVGNPFRRGLRGDAEPQNLSPAVAHDEQPIEQPKPDGRHHEQIHRRNAIGMITQERIPPLGRRSSPARHILGDAGLTNVNAKLEQFAMNASCCSQDLP